MSQSSSRRFFRASSPCAGKSNAMTAVPFFLATARVAKVLEDGRLELAVRDKGYAQREEDAERILALIGSYDGVLPFNDKASPEVILRETGMSKAQFKRAVGKLLKEGRIEIGEKTIRDGSR